MLRCVGIQIMVCTACLALTACRVTTPGRAESGLAHWTKLHITVQGKNDRNPLSGSAEDVKNGQEAFGHYCIVCHGLDGQTPGFRSLPASIRRFHPWLQSRCRVTPTAN